MMRAAFSLVELSIVLVILGLLTGGILTGQNLIRAAELRSVTTEFQQYQTAVHTFRDKYFALPGDMPNATDFWGADPDGCPTGTSAAGTCNGNGSGALILNSADNTLFESGLFWEHLERAGLIEGSYSGNFTCGTHPCGIAGSLVPPARLGGNAYWSLPWVPVVGNGSAGQSDRREFLYVATHGMVPAAGNAPCYGCGGVLSHEEAWNIDTKLDDGIADSGKASASMRVPTVGNAPASDDCDSYDLSNTTERCTLGFQLLN